MYRSSICLNGEWDFMPVYGVNSCLELPKELRFESQKIRVPSSWRYFIDAKDSSNGKSFGIIDNFQPYNTFDYPLEWSKANTGVYRKYFATPEKLINQRLFIKFNGILQRARIIINQKEVATWDESYLPIKIDITDFINKSGEDNEIIVVVSTFEEAVLPSGETKVLGLKGSWFGNIGRGIWEDVFLEICPDTYIENINIRTSVRNKSIISTITISNNRNTKRSIAVQGKAKDSDEIIKFLGQEELNIPENSTATVSLFATWDDAHLWDIDDPYLYIGQIEILENGAIVDTYEIKFGFREVWIEGNKFFLNGTRINLRGDSWHFQGTVQQSKQYALNWYRQCRDNGINFVRLHAEPHPEYYLDAADEIGMLIVDETAIYGSSKSMLAGHPVFIENCKKHVQRLVMRDRNHPCIVIWSLQNEMRWVDGRDIYKLHIPEMMQKIHELDGTRPIILEGDNRLLSKDKSEIESYHYNIDGTIAQWDKTRPLIYGEHGGWWYICPQNSSAYTGLSAYMGFEEATKGIAIKEKLYVEFARKSEVTGITSFNLAHYMMKSIPNEDLELQWESLDTPGCKPKYIRKHSMTINNGLLEGYQLYIPNVALEVLKDSYKAVTIIPAEYNTSFFDDKAISRSFDVYNDTLKTHICTLKVLLETVDEGTICKKSFDFIQEPGERKNIEFEMNPPKVNELTCLTMKMQLFHGLEEVHRLERIYKIYPSHIKTYPIETNDMKTVFWGGEASYTIISQLLPKCKWIDNLTEINSTNCNIVIIGSYIDDNADKYKNILGQFVDNGGIIIQLEQFKFMPGGLNLFKQPFFSAHINDKSHRILEGLTDEDLIFWKPGTKEETPCSIIEQCVVKPVYGDVNMLLECSAGDFGDGGDLWSPLIEYRASKGTIIINQLELVKNFYTVPQACILLRNIINYAISLKPKQAIRTALLSRISNSEELFMDKLKLDYIKIEPQQSFDEYELIIADINSLADDDIKLSGFVKAGGRLLLMPVKESDTALLEKLLECEIKIGNIPTYQLKRNLNNEVVKGISITDMFGFDKVNLTPRVVENVQVCEDYIRVEDSKELLNSVTGTPWYDYYVRGLTAEYAIIALYCRNKDNKQIELPYLIEKNIGKGSIVISQIIPHPDRDKNLRIYTRLLSNMGAKINTDLFEYEKGDKDYAVDYFMTLPHKEYNDYHLAEAYYSDKNFSLNNLGEGLYGWMKKVEKNPQDGFIKVAGSAGNRCFMTCFVDYLQPDSLICDIQVDINCSFKLWVNGELVKEYTKKNPDLERVIIHNVRFENGMNRFVLAGNSNGVDISFRTVFRCQDGSYVTGIKYQLTIDEVDPK